MELTPHVMLVGEGAELFAKHHGFEPSNLLTKEAEASWRGADEGSQADGSSVYEDSYQLAGEDSGRLGEDAARRDLWHDQRHRS
ncbi:MAG: hypothetical protein R2849_03455 [Thermomicrobiales bacterium]